MWLRWMSRLWFHVLLASSWAHLDNARADVQAAEWHTDGIFDQLLARSLSEGHTRLGDRKDVESSTLSKRLGHECEACRRWSAFKGALKANSCGHRCCKRCWRRHLRTNVSKILERMRATKTDQLHCWNCSGPIDAQILRRHGTHDLIHCVKQLDKRKKLIAGVPKSCSVVDCPKSGCVGVGYTARSRASITCFECEHQIQVRLGPVEAVKSWFTRMFPDVIGRKRKSWSDHVIVQLAPRKGWDYWMNKAGIPVADHIDWCGKTPVPQAPYPCWIMPASDEVAYHIAAQQGELRKAGWKVLAAKPHVVDRLNNKASFQRYAADIGLASAVPKFYTRPEDGEYPCVLKPASGEWGSNTYIVKNSTEVRSIVGNCTDFDTKWVLQELIPGSYEYSTSMLVENGNILDIISTRYEYAAEVYIWPFVKELSKAVVDLAPEHLEIMRRLLVGYSGFNNFNYKIRSDGRICMFEANARVGGDLACDVPRLRPDLARAMFERLETVGNGHTSRSERKQPLLPFARGEKTSRDTETNVASPASPTSVDGAKVAAALKAR